jgi:hypothetical protein
VLCYQHQLLVALCDSLNWLRNRSYERTHGDASVLAAAAGELASTEEMGLLQQLQGATYSLRFARLPTQAEMQQPWQGSMPGDTQPIAPPDDMLHLFHKLVSNERSLCMSSPGATAGCSGFLTTCLLGQLCWNSEHQ